MGRKFLWTKFRISFYFAWWESWLFFFPSNLPSAVPQLVMAQGLCFIAARSVIAATIICELNAWIICDSVRRSAHFEFSHFPLLSTIASYPAAVLRRTCRGKLAWLSNASLWKCECRFCFADKLKFALMPNEVYVNSR